MARCRMLGKMRACEKGYIALSTGDANVVVFYKSKTISRPDIFK